MGMTESYNRSERVGQVPVYNSPYYIDYVSHSSRCLIGTVRIHPSPEP